MAPKRSQAARRAAKAAAKSAARATDGGGAAAAQRALPFSESVTAKPKAVLKWREGDDVNEPAPECIEAAEFLFQLYRCSDAEKELVAQWVALFMGGEGAAS